MNFEETLLLWWRTNACHITTASYINQHNINIVVDTNVQIYSLIEVIPYRIKLLSSHNSYSTLTKAKNIRKFCQNENPVLSVDLNFL